VTKPRAYGPAPADHGWDRPRENDSALKDPAGALRAQNISGRERRRDRSATAATGLSALYHCEELDAALRITNSGGALYGAFSRVFWPGLDGGTAPDGWPNLDAALAPRPGPQPAGRLDSRGTAGGGASGGPLTGAGVAI
jgi:hypothetical protein